MWAHTNYGGTENNFLTFFSSQHCVSKEIQNSLYIIHRHIHIQSETHWTHTCIPSYTHIHSDTEKHIYMEVLELRRDMWQRGHTCSKLWTISPTSQHCYVAGELSKIKVKSFFSWVQGGRIEIRGTCFVWAGPWFFFYPVCTSWVLKNHWVGPEHHRTQATLHPWTLALTYLAKWTEFLREKCPDHWELFRDPHIPSKKKNKIKHIPCMLKNLGSIPRNKHTERLPYLNR